MALFINFSLWNKLNHKDSALRIFNRPFMNLVYFHFNFFRFFILNMVEGLDKGESIFPVDHYNYIKTNDRKYMSIGNLEQKFQENTNKIVEELCKNKKNDSNYLYEDEVIKQSNYSIDSLQRIFEQYDRDELFKKV